MTAAAERVIRTDDPSRVLRPGALLRQSGLLVSSLVLAVAIAWALVPGLFTGRSPTDQDLHRVFQSPRAGAWFGTDQLGRDVYSRMVYGASLSLRASLTAVAIALVIGSLIGLLSGYLGGRTDAVLMRCVDVVLAFPALVLAMAVITVLGNGSVQLGVAVGVAMLGTVARVMRSEVLRIRSSAYIEASHVVGASSLTILIRHVLPNAFTPVLAIAVLQFGQAILAIAALSYLGFGAPPPTPEWGSMIAAGQAFLARGWWISVLPGVVIIVVVASANRVSRQLRPRMLRRA